MKIKCQKCGADVELHWLVQNGKARAASLTSSDRSAMAKKGWVKRREAKQKP